MGKSMLRMGSCVRFCCHNILFLRTFPLVSALLANQKLIFDERISCITRHDDFSPRSDRTVSLQVAPFLGDCKGKGYRRRAGQMENEWVYRHQIRDFDIEKLLQIVQHFHMTHVAQWQITDISIVSGYFVCIDFHTALEFITTWFNKISISLFISL